MSFFHYIRYMNTQNGQDILYMDIAFAEAKKAYNAGEIPVGAVLVDDSGQIVSQAHNTTQMYHNATMHAELHVLQLGCAQQTAKYLIDCTLYVTLEPCAMCAMACYWTQIKRLVFGAHDQKRGYQMYTPSLLHPKTIVSKGIRAKSSQRLLQDFFQNLRKKNREA